MFNYVRCPKVPKTDTQKEAIIKKIKTAYLVIGFLVGIAYLAACDGAVSIVWMNAYLADDKTMKDKILQYNEDDCMATLFLKNKLMEMQVD